MLLKVEKGIQGRICHAIHRYAKANNKYIKYYDKDIECNSVELSYLMYLDANNLYGWAISQKLPVNGFEWEKNIPKFHEYFIKNYDEDCNEGYFVEADVEYPKNLFNLHNSLPFLLKRNKIKKCNKLFCNIYWKENYVAHVRALKQALNRGLIFKKSTVIQFNQKEWLKPYIDKNTKLRTEAKNDFEKKLKTNESCCFWKNNGKCKRAQRY